jgi:ABC-type uncharacterized transport system permease subunit
MAGSAFWTLALSVATTVAYVATMLGARYMPEARTRQFLLSAWMLQLITLATMLAGDPAYFGFGPALSMTAWLVLTVYAIEQKFFPRLRTVGFLAGWGAVAVLLAAIFPGKPMTASTSAWLPLHLALGIASYGLFAAAVVHATLMARAEKRMRVAVQQDEGLPLLMLERLTFRFVSAGFVLLTATLLAGWLFGEMLYGRVPPLDHKIVFSVLAWITFAVLLIGRARFGWRGRHAVHMIYAGAGLLLLAYVGSRFVLEVVLERLT